MTPPNCPYCHSQAVLCDASAVYGEKYAGQFNVWRCETPDCDSWVAVRPGPEPTPLGPLANAPLRALRKRLYEALPANTPAQRRIRRSRGVGWMNDEQCLTELARLVGGKESQ